LHRTALAAAVARTCRYPRFLLAERHVNHVVNYLEQRCRRRLVTRFGCCIGI
jgi:hypothetical protein